VGDFASILYEGVRKFRYQILGLRKEASIKQPFKKVYSYAAKNYAEGKVAMSFAKGQSYSTLEINGLKAIP